MELLLVRHARPHLVRDAEAGADPALTDEGQAQALAVARALNSAVYGPVTSVVSSPMRRARETAEPAASMLGLELLTDHRLVEMDAGSPHYGSGFEAFATRAEAWDSLNRGWWEGHEFDPRAFVAQAVEGVEESIARDPEGRVAIFCHGGVVSAYLGHILGTTRSVFFTPDYTGVTRILAQPDGYRELLSVNECGHLAEVADPSTPPRP